jgi:hypothetical protein
VTRSEQIAHARRDTAAAAKASALHKARLTPDVYATLTERFSSYQKQVRILKRTGLSPAYVSAVTRSLEIPKHNRMAVEPSRRVRRFSHSGVYEYNQNVKSWMWSDTASYERASPGDIVTIMDPDAHNLAAPSNP